MPLAPARRAPKTPMPNPLPAFPDAANRSRIRSLLELHQARDVEGTQRGLRFWQVVQRLPPPPLTSGPARRVSFLNFIREDQHQEHQERQRPGRPGTDETQMDAETARTAADKDGTALSGHNWS